MKMLFYSQKNQEILFLINLEIKSEDISESQTNDQRNNIHISSPRPGSQIKTEKEDTIMGEGKLRPWGWFLQERPTVGELRFPLSQFLNQL